MIAKAIHAEREAVRNRISEGVRVEKPSLVGRIIAAWQAARLRETARQTRRPLARNSSVAK
ncbi:MAG: hypothetical protein M1140_11500 [Chloroflexi bacterium]|nr:hypothetical protein [Chloroflexota bacterium]